MRKALLLMGRVLLGAVFVYAAYTKLRQSHFLFAMAIMSYKLVPESGALFLSRVLLLRNRRSAEPADPCARRAAAGRVASGYRGSVSCSTARKSSGPAFAVPYPAGGRITVDANSGENA